MSLKIKNLFVAVLAGLLLITTGCSQENSGSSGHSELDGTSEIEAGIYAISKYGNVILTISPQTMMEYGFEEADIINIEVGKNHMLMPIGTNYSDVDTDRCICRYDLENDPQYVTLAVNGGNFAASMGIADKVDADNEDGYEWIYRDGLDENVTLKISMVEKQGYAEEYDVHKVTATRTNERSDYPMMTDAEYANFRAVTTTGMGKDTLYRSSSPINPKIGRNKEADEALSLNGVRTVINLADNENEMKGYPDYSETYYSRCDIIPLSMGMDMAAEDNRAKLLQGFRFIISHDGPYLIHCLEGKDRTGFAIAILESLMGANIDEVTNDYMRSYYYFYYVVEATSAYDNIQAIIIHELLDAFGISSYTSLAKDEPLTAYAEKYLQGLGMSDQEISDLKARLAVDYGGQN